MKRILLTGFEPFNGARINPSQQVVDALAEERIEEAYIVSRVLPCVFGEAVRRLQEAIDEERPDVVICLGQAGGRPDITPERIAINIDDAPIPDNQGNQPIDQPIVSDGPPAYWSKLPIKRIVAELRKLGISASVSNTAGTYVCNHLFYGLMHLIHTRYPQIRGGFIHIPFLPEQTKESGASSMPWEQLFTGIKTVCLVTAQFADDLSVSEGAEC